MKEKHSFESEMNFETLSELGIPFALLKHMSIEYSNKGKETTVSCSEWVIRKGISCNKIED